MFGLTIDGAGEALKYLLGSNDAWLRACAVYHIGESASEGREDVLHAARNDPDALVRQTAGHALGRIAG